MLSYRATPYFGTLILPMAETVMLHDHKLPFSAAPRKQQARKSASRRLSQALSDTFMIRSSRHTTPVVAVATPGSAAAGAPPGSPSLANCRSSRKLQPMLSQQPQVGRAGSYRKELTRGVDGS